MYKFSSKSKHELGTLHIDLQIILNELLNYIDFSILKGHRGKEEQNKAYESGSSKLKFPRSKHNTIPSEAVDIKPYPKADKINFYYLAGYFKGVAKELFKQGRINSEIRWGGDWDGDNDLKDQNFYDLYHFEIKR